MVGGRRGDREEEGRVSGLHLAMELTLTGILNKRHLFSIDDGLYVIEQTTWRNFKGFKYTLSPKNPCKKADTQAQRKH